MNAKIKQLKGHHDRITAAIEQLGIVQSNLREELAGEYVAASGKSVHASDCSTSCAPAELPKECDCDA